MPEWHGTFEFIILSLVLSFPLFFYTCELVNFFLISLATSRLFEKNPKQRTTKFQKFYSKNANTKKKKKNEHKIIKKGRFWISVKICPMSGNEIFVLDYFQWILRNSNRTFFWIVRSPSCTAHTNLKKPTNQIVFPQGNKGYQPRGPTPYVDFKDSGMPGKQHANNFNSKNQNRKNNYSKTRWEKSFSFHII